MDGPAPGPAASLGITLGHHRHPAFTELACYLACYLACGRLRSRRRQCKNALTKPPRLLDNAYACEECFEPRVDGLRFLVAVPTDEAWVPRPLWC